MIERLADTEEIRKIESRFANLISRTFLKGAVGVPASDISNSVKKAFSSKTYEVQLDKIIDDIYIASVAYADSKTEELDISSPSGSAQASRTAAGKDKPLPITEEAIKQTKALSGDAAESVTRWLKDNDLYTQHPDQLARQVKDLWGGEKYKARRFAVTFTADLAENTAIHRYNDLGIQYLQFYAEIDEKTTPQCRQFHGTIIKTNSLDAQRYRPPLHHYCRSCLIPATSKTLEDQDLLIENRDFTQHFSQDFEPLKMKTDFEEVNRVLDDIGKFNEKYRIDQFILDEDIQLRLMKLNLSVVTKIPQPELTDFTGKPGPGKPAPGKVKPEKPETKTIENIVQGYESKIKGLPKEHGYLIDPVDGRIVISKDGTKNSVSFNGDELEKFKGRIFTHNHPSSTSFSKNDVNLACTCELKEIRAVGANRTYVLRMKNGTDLIPGLGNRMQRNYKIVENQVIQDLFSKVRAGEMSIENADLTCSHEIWSRLTKDIKQLEYTYIEGK